MSVYLVWFQKENIYISVLLLRRWKFFNGRCRELATIEKKTKIKTKLHLALWPSRWTSHFSSCKLRVLPVFEYKHKIWAAEISRAAYHSHATWWWCKRHAKDSTKEWGGSILKRISFAAGHFFNFEWNSCLPTVVEILISCLGCPFVHIIFLDKIIHFQFIKEL